MPTTPVSLRSAPAPAGVWRKKKMPALGSIGLRPVKSGPGKSVPAPSRSSVLGSRIRPVQAARPCQCKFSASHFLRVGRACFLGATVFALASAANVSADWYKGVTHVHSLWSDGDTAPEWITKWYKDRGYEFVAFSEHNVLQSGEKWMQIGGRSNLKLEHLDALRTDFGADWPILREANGRPEAMRLRTFDELSAHFNVPGAFLLIPGEEMTAIGAGVHTNAINVREAVRSVEGTTRSEILENQVAAIEAQSKKFNVPMIAHLNHMNWSNGVTAEEVLGAPSLRFFEVYNGHPGTHPWGRAEDGMPPSDEAWDIIQSTRLNRDPNTPLLYGVATDDSHEYHQWGLGRVNPGRGWVMVYAESLDADALMRAMQAGLFYSTTGVTLDKIDKTDKELRVTIAAQPGAKYTTRFIGTRAGFDTTTAPRLDFEGKPLPRASLKYSGEVGAVLLETTDNPAVYPFKGDELYVRARVYSDQPQDNPVDEGDFQTAWVQPVKP